MGLAVGERGEVCIIMDLMQASLADVIREPSFAPYVKWDGALLSIASDVIKGMSYIHYHGMTHRDLKPGNVLIDSQWIAKIADFGTVKMDTEVLAEADKVAGTPPYMAPERVASASNRRCRKRLLPTSAVRSARGRILSTCTYDKPVDVWAFGCLLAHMGTGRPPYEQLRLTSPQEVFKVIRSGEFSPLELLEGSSTPTPIAAIASKCCRRDPSARPDFTSIANELSESCAIGDDELLRPTVRVKDKRVAKLSAPAPEAPLSGRRQSSARSKFVTRGRAGSSTEIELEDVGAGGERASEPSPGSPKNSSRSPRDGLLDTFSHTLLHTFTGGDKAEAASAPPDAQPAAPPPPRFCTQCGTKVGDAGSKFCNGCGAALDKPTELPVDYKV